VYKTQINIPHLYHISIFSQCPLWFYTIPVCCTWAMLNTSINIIITPHTLRASVVICGDCFMHYNNKQLRSLEIAVGIDHIMHYKPVVAFQQPDHTRIKLNRQKNSCHTLILLKKTIYKVYPCTGTEALHRLYGPLGEYRYSSTLSWPCN